MNLNLNNLYKVLEWADKVFPTCHHDLVVFTYGDDPSLAIRFSAIPRNKDLGVEPLKIQLQLTKKELEDSPQDIDVDFFFQRICDTYITWINENSRTFKHPYVPREKLHSLWPRNQISTEEYQYNYPA